MKHSNWLDFVNEKLLLRFFQDYNRRISPSIFEVTNIKIIEDEKFGKIARIKSCYYVDDNLNFDCAYKYSYFCAFGELKKTKNGFEFVMPETFENIKSYSGLAFPMYVNKYARTFKIDGKTYLENYKEFIGNELQKKLEKKILVLKNENNEFNIKLNNVIENERLFN